KIIAHTRERGYSEQATRVVAMVTHRLSIMMTLVPILSRLEGRVVALAAARYPQLNSAFPTASNAPGAATGSRRSSSTTGTSSSSHPLLQRRRPRSHSLAGNTRGRPVVSTRTLAVGDESAVLGKTERASAEGLLGVEDAREALRSLFGHDDFRDGQEEVVAKLLAGESCAGVFP
ncbi:unnamed protein product, partial [Ectocarpus sp. 12 AP-2014]